MKKIYKPGDKVKTELGAGAIVLREKRADTPRYLVKLSRCPQRLAFCAQIAGWFVFLLYRIIFKDGGQEMTDELLQNKIDLAKKILFAELFKKSKQDFTKTESEIFFWLSADPVVKDIMVRMDAPASS